MTTLPNRQHHRSPGARPGASPGTAWRVMALVLVAALLLPACRRQSPQQQLAKTLEGTLRSSFAFTFTVNADRDALGALGPEGEQAGLFLQGFKVSGKRSGGANELTVSVLGINALELRALGPDSMFLRLGIDDLSKLTGGSFDPSTTIIPLLQQRGLSKEILDAVTAAFRGRWVGVRGKVDTAQLRQIVGGEQPGAPQSPPPSLREALGGDLNGFVERYIVVNNVREDQGERVFEVGIRMRDLLRALANVEPSRGVQDLEAELQKLPETVPGTIGSRDGAVTRIVFDLAEAARAAGEKVNGSIALRLELSDHGKVDPIQAPGDAVTVSGDQFLQALRAMSGLVQDLGPAVQGAPGVGTRPGGTPTPARPK